MAEANDRNGNQGDLRDSMATPERLSVFSAEFSRSNFGKNVLELNHVEAAEPILNLRRDRSRTYKQQQQHPRQDNDP